jgi:hypothetical protein
MSWNNFEENPFAEGANSSKSIPSQQYSPISPPSAIETPAWLLESQKQNHVTSQVDESQRGSQALDPNRFKYYLNLSINEKIVLLFLIYIFEKMYE